MQHDEQDGSIFRVADELGVEDDVAGFLEPDGGLGQPVACFGPRHATIIVGIDSAHKREDYRHARVAACGSFGERSWRSNALIVGAEAMGASDQYSTGQTRSSCH